MLREDPAVMLTFEDAARHPLLPAWQVCCFSINFIMGSGFLGIPAGFLETGLTLGVLVLLLVTWMQWAAACMLVQVITRAHALLLAKQADATLTPTLTPFAKLGGGGDVRGDRRPPPALLVPSHTSYELIMLCRLHLGKWAERGVSFCATLYMFGSLWSYTSVFASSLAAMVPMPWLQAGEPCDIYQTDVYGGGCITLYYFWIMAFCTLMVALLALDIREQVVFQCVMTVARALVILVMVASLVLGERADFGLPPAPEVADFWQSPLGRVRWAGLPTMVPIGVFCQLFQVGVPCLIQPAVRKRDFSAIFACALCATLLMYTALGLAAAWRLGDDVDPSCNLNWKAYRSPALGFAVALFPAIDCLSVFPMSAIFLSNNLMASVFQRRWHAGSIRRRTRYGCRLLCCAPPFACAFAFPSLAKALDFTGIVGIILPFIVTPLLAAASLRECRAFWGRATFDRAEAAAGFSAPCASQLPVVMGLGALGTLLLVYCVMYGF